MENEEFCLWVISNSELLSVQEATSALRDALPDLDRYVAERSIEVVGHEDWFLSGKTFDPHRVADRFRKKLNEALARGYAGMRVNGSPAWLQDAGPKELHKFEAELDKLFPNERTIASCTYPLASIGGEEIFDVVRTHQFAIARRQGEWEVIETPELIQAKQEIKRLNAELEQRVIERTRDLAAANAELRKEIAERKRAEDALRRSEDRLRLVIDTVPALIHCGLPDGQLDFFNQRWLDFVGLSLEDLSGWKWTAAIHPEDVAAMVERWRAALATGEPYEYEARVRRADGEYRRMVHREVPLRDERGNIVKWYASSIDIEDRKRAEDALRQSEERFAAFMDNLPGYAWMKDLQGRYVYVNEMVRGLPGYRSLGKTDAQIWPPNFAAEYRANDQRVIATKRPLQTLEHFQQEGKQRYMAGSKFPIFDKTGAVALVGGAGVDITERIEAEEQLKITSEQLRALSARLQSTREEEGTRIAREIHDEVGGALTSLKWDLEETHRILAGPIELPQLAALREKLHALMKLADTAFSAIRRIASELRPIILDDLGLMAAIEWQAQQFQARTGIVCHCECSLEKIELNDEQSTAVFR